MPYPPGSYRDRVNAQKLVILHARTQSFIDQGLCRNCGREREPNRKFCYEHLRYFRQYQRERRQQRLRAEKV
jgi:hypothetical protein